MTFFYSSHFVIFNVFFNKNENKKKEFFAILICFL